MFIFSEVWSSRKKVILSQRKNDLYGFEMSGGDCVQPMRELVVNK